MRRLTPYIPRVILCGMFLFFARELYEASQELNRPGKELDRLSKELSLPSKEQPSDGPPPQINIQLEQHKEMKKDTSLDDQSQSHIYDELDFLILSRQQAKGGVTALPVESGRPIEVRVQRDGKDFQMKPGDYRTFRANEFIELFANPVEKQFEHPEILHYTSDMPRPSPLLLIKDTEEKVDMGVVMRELSLTKMQKNLRGDFDLTKLTDIQYMDQGGKSVPNIIHYIWFGCRKFKVYHYISLLSALKHQKPEKIFFHTNCKPKGVYWDRFFNEAGTVLKIIAASPPTQIFGKPIKHVEHQADVARLQILMEVGGIYLDDDVVVLKSLDPLRQYDMVLAEENTDAVGNGIILANRDAWFLKRWYQEYQNFNDSVWSESSCFVPWSLWQLFPDKIHVEQETMLRPNWEEVSFIYHELWNWHKSYTVHLYSRFMLKMDGTSERTLQELSILNTTYGELARYVIWGSSQPRDIRPFILNIDF